MLHFSQLVHDKKCFREEFERRLPFKVCPPLLSYRKVVWKSQWPPKEASKADPRRFPRVKERTPMPQRKLKQRWAFAGHRPSLAVSPKPPSDALHPSCSCAVVPPLSMLMESRAQRQCIKPVGYLPSTTLKPKCLPKNRAVLLAPLGAPELSFRLNARALSL